MCESLQGHYITVNHPGLHVRHSGFICKQAINKGLPFACRLTQELTRAAEGERAHEAVTKGKLRHADLCWMLEHDLVWDNRQSFY